jgi:fused signal recognition particle receptor
VSWDPSFRYSEFALRWHSNSETKRYGLHSPQCPGSSPWRSGYSCLIAAADTFRAAAVQQVSVWGERSGVPVMSNPSANADPAAVVSDAIGAAKAKGTERMLVDTAGRLQTKQNLMEELSKVRRFVDKLAPEAVVESLLVLDASQGQNGLRQAMAFTSAAGLTGVVR